MKKFKNRVITLLFLSSFIIAQPTIDLIESAFGEIGSTITISGYFWSSTESGSLFARARKLYYDRSVVYRNDYIKRIGHSVRCVRD